MTTPTNANALQEQGARGIPDNSPDHHIATGDLAVDLSAAAQRLRLLLALCDGPVSTLSARRTLSVMHPGARIMELRRQGHPIATLWSREPDALGIEHRQAQYALVSSREVA